MSFFYASIGVLALAFTLSSLLRHLKSRTVDATFLYMAALTILPSLTGTVAQLTGGRRVDVGYGTTTSVTMSAVASTISTLTGPAIALCAAAYVIAVARRGVSFNPAGIFLWIALMAGAFGGLNAMGQFSTGLSLLTYVAAAPLLVAPRGLSGISGAAHALGLQTGLSGIVALTSPQTVMVACGDRKCGALGHLFTGVSFNYNSFGLLMALAVPVLYLGLNRFKLPMAVIASVLGILSESRTSQIAIALTLSLIVVHAAFARHGKRPPAFLFVAAAAGPAALTVTLPLSAVDSGTFTGRAGLWELALGRIAESPIVGLGPDSWSAMQTTGDIRRAAAYSVHNQVIDVLFIGGFVGLLGFFLFVGYVLRSNMGDLTSILLILVPIATVSITERPWSIGRLDWLSWSLFLIATVWLNARNPRQKESQSKKVKLCAEQACPSPEIIGHHCTPTPSSVRSGP